MTRKPAERSAWGENKERYSIFVTPTAMKAIDTRAQVLGISRSEFLEQFARLVAGMTDTELKKEDREELTKSVGGDTKRQFRILLVTLKTYWTKKHGFLVFRGL